jgi:hypothetical protein
MKSPGAWPSGSVRFCAMWGLAVLELALLHGEC